MTGKKSLLIVLPSFVVGGMQRVASLLANELTRMGVDVTLYSLAISNHQFFKLDERIRILEPNTKSNSSFILIRYLSYINGIKSACEMSGAGKILVFGKIQSALTLLALPKRKTDIFISDRASPLQRDSFHMLLLTRIVFKLIQPGGVIAQTNLAALFQRNIFGAKIRIEVIPNPVKEIIEYDIRRENIVLAVGRLGDSLKGFDRLIEAWSLVNAPEWKLIIVGGNEKDDPVLFERIRELGIVDRIQLMDKTEDVDTLYARSSIFVIPSRSEGFPNALAEAMCAGLACISFDFMAGPRDMITNNVNGVIVNENDIVQLGQEISSLIDNPFKRKELGFQAKLLKIKLNLKSITTKYLDFIYERI